jgi:hypothetical protein
MHPTQLQHAIQQAVRSRKPLQDIDLLSTINQGTLKSDYSFSNLFEKPRMQASPRPAPVY